MHVLNIYKPHKKICGFNLIEVVVTLAILALLATFAVGSYTKYTLRTKVSGMIAAGNSAQFAVVNDYFNQGSALSGIDYSANSAPFTTAQVDFISSISITNGVITVTGNSSNLYGRSISITLTPTVTNNDFSWACAITAAYLSLAPKDCQNSI